MKFKVSMLGIFLSLVVLLCSFAFNKSFYVLDKKELAKELKNEGVEKIFTDDKKLDLRLKFYGIDTHPDANLRLAILDQKDNYGNIAVYKFGVKIANFKIIKDG